MSEVNRTPGSVLGAVTSQRGTAGDVWRQAAEAHQREQALAHDDHEGTVRCAAAALEASHPDLARRLRDTADYLQRFTSTDGPYRIAEASGPGTGDVPHIPTGYPTHDC